MRLLNVHTLKLESFFGTQPPPYAILSHTWEQEEVLFADIQDEKAAFPDHKRGAFKIKESCIQARQLGFDHVWIDTCCIDKTSSAELPESINSMFAWYREAEVCFAYLGDVNDPNYRVEVAVESSRWFTRGWTLQELVAPRQVFFYDSQWSELGRREANNAVQATYNSRFADMLARVTRIPLSLLCRDGASPVCSLSPPLRFPHHLMRLYNGACQVCFGRDTLPRLLKDRFSNAEKMSWAARRVTTRREDQAYCLLGLFGVHMPLLYGEGDAAFIRLQEEILRKSDDPSLLAFDSSEEENAPYTVDRGLLAPSANFFDDSPIRLPHSSRMDPSNRITVDSKTIGVRLWMCPHHGDIMSKLWLGILPCRYKNDRATRPALLLESVSNGQAIFSRLLVKMIMIRPVATKVTVSGTFSILHQEADVVFDLAKVELQDIQLVLRKSAWTLTFEGPFSPPRESPAVRIFLQSGIKLLRMYPENLDHDITETSRAPAGANVDSLKTYGSMIYVPAQSRNQY